MEDMSIEILKALVVLLPGFVTVGVVRSLSVEEAKNDLDKVIRALAYSFLDYCLLSLVKLLVAVVGGQGGAGLHTAYAVPSSASDLLLLFCLSVLLGCLVGWYRQLDGHRVLRRLGLTSRTARLSIWHDVFADKRNCDIAVVFKDGRQLFGWPEYYSDDSTEGCLFLTQARWYYRSEQGDLVDEAVSEPGILIRCAQDIDFIQFQSRTPARTPGMRAAEDARTAGTAPGPSRESGRQS